MTTTELLPQSYLDSGDTFRVDFSFAHIPGANTPGVADVNAALQSVGAGVTVDSINQEGIDNLANLLSLGTGVFAEMYGHVVGTDDSVTGAQLQAWFANAAAKLGQTFSVHMSNISISLVTDPSKSGGIFGGGLAGQVANSAADSAGGVGKTANSLFGAVQWTAIAVVVIGGIFLYMQVRRA